MRERFDIDSLWCAGMKTIAVSESVRGKIGDVLEEMGYTVAVVKCSSEDEPVIEEDAVDAMFLMSFPGIFSKPNSMLSALERERKQVVGRDNIVPKVKQWVHVPSAGLNHVSKMFEKSTFMTSGAEKDGAIKLTHTPGVQGLPMGEYVVAHILSSSKKIPAHMIAQSEQSWEPMKIKQRSLRDQVVGLLGCGGIGLHVARLMKGFGVKTLGTKRSVSAHFVSADDDSLDEYDSLVTEWYPSDDASMIEVFSRSDYVVCCLPLSPATKHCITTRHFEALGKQGTFINVSRGDVVDQGALIDALEKETIEWAILDVTTPEPLPTDHRLWTTKNVSITAHDSWKTDESEERIFENFLDNARRFIKGEALVAEVEHLDNAVSYNVKRHHMA